MNLLQKILRIPDVSDSNSKLAATIYFAFFANGIMSIMLGALLPLIMNTYSLNYSQSGLMLSAHQLGNLCAVLIAGWLPYIIGRKKSTLIMGFGTVLGMTLIALVGNPWLLVIAFAFTGIGRGTMSNICNVVVADVSGNKTGGINLLHAVFATGALLAPIIVLVFSNNLGWKAATVFVALTCLTAWFLLSRSKLSSAAASEKKEGSNAFLKSKYFWIDAMILFFYLCAEASIIGWFVVYFEDTGILPPAIAKLTPTILWVMIMIGRLSCAAVSARVDKNKLLLVLGVSFALFFTGLMFSSNTAMCLICLIGVGVGMAGIYPTTLSTAREPLSTMSTGVLISVASLGAILMPGIIGAVSDSMGISGGIALVLAALVAMVALIIVKLVLSVKNPINS